MQTLQFLEHLDALFRSTLSGSLGVTIGSAVGLAIRATIGGRDGLRNGLSSRLGKEEDQEHGLRREKDERQCRRESVYVDFYAGGRERGRKRA